MSLPQSCIVSNGQQGETPPVAERSQIICVLMRKLINDHSKQFPDEFMVSISSFKSSSTQLDVHLVNYGPI